MTLVDRDLEYVWHPFTQMKGAEIIGIIKGKGSYIYDEQGNSYIDAVSSWWVNTHGHAHPYIGKKLMEQFDCLEHVIFAGFTHPKAVEAAERILAFHKGYLDKLFYSDNGSTAVEVAIKMAIQYWHNKGEKRCRIIALEGSYHGDTFGSMSISQRSEFTKPFAPNLFECSFIPSPTQKNISETIELLKKEINRGDVAAFIYEPIIQGVRGMVMHEPSLLNILIGVCKEHNVLCIADEVFTGFGRTGKMFASQYMSNKPDIMSMSKGLTAGVMALGATACSNMVYNAFYDDDQKKEFFHGHSYTANPLACAVVCASLDLFEKQETWQNIERIFLQQKNMVERVKYFDSVSEARSFGTVLAIEMNTDTNTSYFNNKGKDAYRFFMKRGILLRPLGNILIVLPPYCITEDELKYVHDTIIDYMKS